MSSNSTVRRAVRLALGATAGSLTALYAPGALAQDEPQGDLEEILVTGSRIPRADLASASPVSVIDREDIVLTGLTDVGNLIQRMPSMSGSPIGTTTNNGGNGSVQINLRGMGTDRTVVLINGRRTVDGGDFQTIPTQMIERVEILKDGASAVYGADAVAGVVNIITREDFEGLSVDVQTADFFDMDSGAQLSAGFIAGNQFEGGNFVFGAEYVDQEQAYQKDAPWDYFQDTYYIYPEGCEGQVTQAYPTGCYPLGSSRIPESRLNTSVLGQAFDSDDTPTLFDWFNGVGEDDDAFDPAFAVPTFEHPDIFMNAGNGVVPYDGRTYNFAPINYIQTPYQRTNIFAEANFDLTETVRFSTAIRGNFRESAQELAPQPYNSPTDPGYQGFYQQIDPITNLPLRQVTEVIDGEEFTHYTADQTIGSVVPLTPYTGISEDNFYNTLGLPIIDARRRMVETVRRFTQDITQYQFVTGLTGEFNELNWEVFYNHGYRSRTDHDFGQFFGPFLANAMGPSADLDGDGSPECYEDISNPATIIPGCVPFNFFGGPGSVTQEMIDYVGVDLTDTFLTTLETAGFSVSGSWFDLPGGELGWAAGYSYRADTFEFQPDSGKQADQVTGNTGAGTVGSLYNNAVFLELLAPVVEDVNVKAGVRYDDYNAFSGETTWQLGVEWQVLDSLKLRGTGSTVFRAPTITDLYGGIVDSFPTYSDPCIPAAGDPLPAGCEQVGVQTDSQVLARVGGNPELQPESGETFTGGLVWTSELAGGDASLTLDYWQIELEDGISSLGVQKILTDCYVNQNPASCALVTRRADYSIAQIVDTDLNVAEQGAKGIDTELRWNFENGLGQWEAALLWSHLLERTKTATPSDPEEDLSGRFTDPTAEDGGAYAEDKVNYSLQWYRAGFSVGLLGEYISALDADTFCNCDSDGDPSNNGPDGRTYIQEIDAQLYHDLVATYQFADTGTTVAMGITNVTDEAPPFIEIGFNATTDPSTYRLFGRGYYVRLTQSFE